MRSAVLQMPTYAALALLLIGGTRLQGEVLDPESKGDVDAARRLIAVIETFHNGGFAGVRSVLSLSDNQFDGVKEHLESIVQHGDTIAERGYAALPVDRDRVSAFMAALRSGLVAARAESLAGLLAVNSGEESDATGANFGIDQLVPRWFFVETHVMADPVDLAGRLVPGLVRGEGARVLDAALADLSGAPEAALDSLAALVAADIEARGLENPVVVTNSYQAHLLLTGQSAGDPSESEPLIPYQVLRVFDKRPPYGAVLSPAGLLTVRLRRPAPRVDGDVLLEDLGVVVGVSELSADEMNGIVERESRTSLEEVRLRGSVRVRVMEHLEIVMDAASRPSIWTLPESSW